MPLTLPSYVAPNELIQSAWGNSVVDALAEVDAEFAELGGAIFTGAVLVDGAVIRGGMTGGSQFQVVDTNGGNEAWIAFHGAGSDISTLGTRTGLIGHANSTDIEIRSEAAGADIRLRSADDILFLSADIERARWVGAGLLFGKTVSDLDDAGVEIYGGGSATLGAVRSTTDTASLQNFACRHMGPADANGENFTIFTRTSAGTVIGSIDQNGTTGVNYNTTSDERLKTSVGLDAADGLDTLAAVTIRRFHHGDPGVTQLGVFAQELYDVIPAAVRVGGDDPVTNPWQAAYGSPDIVSHLILAVQQLSARVAELEAA